MRLRSRPDCLGFVAGAALAALVTSVPALAAGPTTPPKTTAPAATSGTNRVSSPPSTSKLTRSALGTSAGTSPFAWVDDASLLPPATAALTFSALAWRGTDSSEVDLPVGVAVGVAPRFQLSARVPYIVGDQSAGVTGGLGTTFLSGKIGILPDSAGVKLSVAPTLEVLGSGVTTLTPTESRAGWGLPVSAEFDPGPARVFASAGYFSGGIGFAGGGLSLQVSPRAAVSGSLSHSWASSTSATGPAPDRTDAFVGASFVVISHLAVFGSIGHTIGTSDANGAGTTFLGGVSILTVPLLSRP